VKAREALTQKVGGDGFTIRNLVKEPLDVAELRKLAKSVGGPENLVAPKRRKEAEGLSGAALFEWLAADGARVRRPIIVTARGTTVGFAGDAKARLDEIL
jgi:arsenate reductase-like glutaredoxin family protein